MGAILNTLFLKNFILKICIALDPIINHVTEDISKYGIKLLVTRPIKNIAKAKGIAPGPPFQNLAGGILKYRSTINTPNVIAKNGRNSYCACTIRSTDKAVVMIMKIPTINPSNPSVNSPEYIAN